jgi:hypothetical protein
MLTETKNRWVVSLGVIAASALLMFPRQGEAPSAQQLNPEPATARENAAPDPADSATRPGDAVRIEREIIRVKPSPQAVPSTRSASGRFVPTERDPRAAESQTFVVRARRALVGDGRYRPEPFPRPSVER